MDASNRRNDPPPPTPDPAAPRADSDRRRRRRGTWYVEQRIATGVAIATATALLLATACKRPYRRSESEPEPSGRPADQVQTQPDPRWPRDPDATADRRGFWVEQPTETGAVSSTGLANRIAAKLPGLRRTCCSRRDVCGGRDGRLLLGLAIAPDGTVERARIEETTLYDRRLTTCMLEDIRTWTLSSHEEDAPVEVVVPVHVRILEGDAG